MMSKADVDILNQRLIDYYGTDVVTGLPIFRIVFSEDQFEKRLMPVNDKGEDLLVPEVREVPKYRQWVSASHILERLVIVPEVNREELAYLKISYELLFRYWDKNGNYLPPNWEVTRFVIETVLTAQHGPGRLKKYIDKEYNQESSLAERKKRIDSIKEYLWGDSSSLGGSSVNCGESSFVPSNYEKVG